MMFVTLIVLAVTTLLAYLLYAYRKVHHFFDERGLKYHPGVPVFGNILKSTFYKRHGIDDLDDVYKSFPDEKYVGYIDAMTPIILIRDPEITRLITTKNFDHFVDHKQYFSPEVEPLFGGSLFMMRGEKWKDMRTTLTPAFTSSKMRLMMPFMLNITDNVIEHIRNNKNEEINVDNLVRRYTNDVIASTAFGVQINSFTDQDNEFYRTGQGMFSFGIVQNLNFFLTSTFPSIYKKLGITVFSNRILKFFTNVVNVTIDYREKNNVVRPDMIQLLMEASKGTLKAENEDEVTNEELIKPPRQWSRSDLMSQVFIFFVAGFESSASAVSLAIHELALNPHVQDKLYQEIEEYHVQNGELNFDSIPSLKYLDCVFNETLRKWSPGLIMDRVCAKEYELPPPREGAKPVKLNPGDIVYNMINCIHMDPKYYPNPDVFDPDRFRDDKRHIQPFTFVPFGMGPRNCIGIRFAILEVKVILYYLVLNFKILKSPKTMDPIQLEPHSFIIKVQGNTWVRFEARQSDL